MPVEPTVNIAYLKAMMRLLDLSDGGTSLEYGPSENALVMARLRRFGLVSVQRKATFALLKVGKERLVHMDEWNEPCLIASSQRGRAMLQAIANIDEALAAAE